MSQAIIGAFNLDDNAGIDSTEFGPGAAFDRKLDTYYLSECNGTHSWIEVTVDTEIKIFGMQMFSSSLQRFPYSYVLEGKSGENTSSWKSLLFIKKEDVPESDSEDSYQMQIICLGLDKCCASLSVMLFLHGTEGVS